VANGLDDYFYFSLPPPVVTGKNSRKVAFCKSIKILLRSSYGKPYSGELVNGDWLIGSFQLTVINEH
jgi:hypothetical protein